MCDASALIEYLLLTELGKQVGRYVEADDSDLHIPELCDVEIISVLRKVISDKTNSISAVRAEQAIEDLLDLPLTRHSHEPLLARGLALRNNFSAYDAMYVALAEALEADLITADRALATAPFPKGLQVIAF